MTYAEVFDVEAGFRTLTEDERGRCEALLGEAAILIDTYNPDAGDNARRLVSCRMVRRVLGDGIGGDAPLYPMGASQGSASALGYTQSWTLTGGTAGELYLSKLDKKLLGVGSKIGAYSPVEGLCDAARD